MKYILQVCLLMLTVLFLSFENKIHFSSVSNAQARIDVPESVNNKIRQQSNSIRVLIIPCSNGYGYSGAGYDFNPVIERELNKNSYLKVLDFPYKNC